MSIQEIISSLSSFGLLLALLLGLWLAYRLLQRLALAQISAVSGGVLPPRSLFGDFGSLALAFLLLLWLALGGLLSAPFVELLLVLQSLATLVFNPYQFPAPPETVAFLGLAPWQYESLFRLLQTAAVYAGVLWVTWQAYRQGRLAFLDRPGFDRLERAAVLLTFAALVDGAVNTFVSAMVLFLARFLERWEVYRTLVAWGILALLIVLLWNILVRRLIRREQRP